MRIYTGQRNRQGELEILVSGWVLQSRSGGSLSGIRGEPGLLQLSLALCADALQDEERAETVHKQFKAKVVALLPKDKWSLTEQEIFDAIYEIESDGVKTNV